MVKEKSNRSLYLIGFDYPIRFLFTIWLLFTLAVSYSDVVITTKDGKTYRKRIITIVEPLTKGSLQFDAKIIGIKK
jgi:hypothetical protein